MPLTHAKICDPGRPTLVRQGLHRSTTQGSHQQSDREPGPSRGYRDASIGIAAAAGASRPSLDKLVPVLTAFLQRQKPGRPAVLRGRTTVCHGRRIGPAHAQRKAVDAQSRPARRQKLCNVILCGHLCQPLVRITHQPAGVGPKLGKLYARLFDRGAACRRYVVSPAVGRDRSPRAAKLRDVQPGQVVTVAVTIGKHRPGPPRLTGAVPYLCKRRHRRHHADVLQSASRLSGRSIAGGRGPLRIRHCRTLRRMLQMVHPIELWTRRGLPRCRWSSRCIHSRKASPSVICRAVDGALATSARVAEWQDEAWVARERFPTFASALRQLHRPAQPP